MLRQIQPLLKDIQLPKVGVESIRIRGGELQATIVGESLARRISDISLTARLSLDYHDLTVDVAGPFYLYTVQFVVDSYIYVGMQM